jgi:hypothetical protein
MALGQAFCEYFGFPYEFSFHRFFHIHHHLSSGAGTIGQLVVDVPSGLSLTPLQGGGDLFESVIPEFTFSDMDKWKNSVNSTALTCIWLYNSVFPTLNVIYPVNSVKAVGQLAALSPPREASERVSRGPMVRRSWRHVDPAGCSHMLMISLSLSSNIIVHNCNLVHRLVSFKSWPPRLPWQRHIQQVRALPCLMLTTRTRGDCIITLLTLLTERQLSCTS